MNNENKEASFDIVFTMNRNLNNDISSYELLIGLNNILAENTNKSILLDFKGTEFISANLLALLGGILSINVRNNNMSFALVNVHPKIMSIIKKNGFGEYFKLEAVKDVYHSTMKYTVFQATTEQLQNFERYMLLNVLNRPEMPLMDEAIKNCIIDNFLEIFNNVIDHANCELVFVCGQFFHRSKKLSFSIVDFGNTIQKNVNNYFDLQNQKSPTNTLEWALQPGNSTKTTTAPGGLGFSILHKFLSANQGEFTLISANESYELKGKKRRFVRLLNHFPGTIVTITINLKDDFAYILNEDTSELIIL